jgi:hypothetical protein
MKNNTNISKEMNYSLYNLDNYKKELDCEVCDVVSKLSQLYLEYYKFISENIKLKRRNLSKFIIIRGLDTIINVFNYILFYTKNIDVTYFHCQKSFYFYVEFVEQITEDEKMFLQLSSKDATMYVYKKTIYEINKTVIKNEDLISDYSNIKLNIIESYASLYKTLILHLINNDYNNKNHLILLKELFDKLEKVNDKSIIHRFNPIVDHLYYNISDVNKFYTIILAIAKKIIKNVDTKYIEIIELNIKKDEFENKLKEEEVDKFIAWFMK